ncbi:MAG: hypothetical protein ABSA01_07085 [Anaerolineales bacterium]|jgi:hypothetical protein
MSWPEILLASNLVKWAYVTSPDIPIMDNPGGTLTTTGADISSPASGPGIAAAPRSGLIRIFERVLSTKGKNEKI